MAAPSSIGTAEQYQQGGCCPHLSASRMPLSQRARKWSQRARITLLYITTTPGRALAHRQASSHAQALAATLRCAAGEATGIQPHHAAPTCAPGSPSHAPPAGSPAPLGPRGTAAWRPGWRAGRTECCLARPHRWPCRLRRGPARPQHLREGQWPADPPLVSYQSTAAWAVAVALAQAKRGQDNSGALALWQRSPPLMEALLLALPPWQAVRSLERREGQEEERSASGVGGRPSSTAETGQWQQSARESSRSQNSFLIALARRLQQHNRTRLVYATPHPSLLTRCGRGGRKEVAGRVAAVGAGGGQPAAAGRAACTSRRGRSRAASGP